MVMLRSALQLRGYRIDVKDGEIGKAHDVFFDDAQWVVRYLVVDTGTWLPGRRVLISPVSLGRPDWMHHVFPVELTKEELENSPSVDADKPVSRQLEADVVGYFGWPAYWLPAAYAAGSIGSGSPPPPVAPQPEQGSAEEPAEVPDFDPHLRSVREVAGYHIGAADGEIGHVEDFVIDDEAWTIRYIVVDTRNWLPGRKVILAPEWFTRFDWRESKAYTDLSKTTIKDAPTYDPSQPVNRDYEGKLYDYYGRPGYWAGAMSPTANWKF
jgi:hypothetical protein